MQNKLWRPQPAGPWYKPWLYSTLHFSSLLFLSCEYAGLWSLSSVFCVLHRWRIFRSILAFLVRCLERCSLHTVVGLGIFTSKSRALHLIQIPEPNSQGKCEFLPVIYSLQLETAEWTSSWFVGSARWEKEGTHWGQKEGVEARRKSSVGNFLWKVCIWFLFLFSFFFFSVFCFLREGGYLLTYNQLPNLQFFGVYPKAGNLIIYCQFILPLLKKIILNRKEKSMTYKGKYGIQTSIFSFSVFSFLFFPSMYPALFSYGL